MMWIIKFLVLIVCVGNRFYLARANCPRSNSISADSSSVRSRSWRFSADMRFNCSVRECRWLSSRASQRDSNSAICIRHGNEIRENDVGGNGQKAHDKVTDEHPYDARHANRHQSIKRVVNFTNETPSSSWINRPLALSEEANFSVRLELSADNLALSWNIRQTKKKKKELTFFIVAHQWMMIYADDYRARPAPVGAPSVFWKSFKNTRQPIAVTYLNMSREANIRKADGDVSQNEVVLPREREATSQSLTSLMACIDSLSRASSSLDCSSCCCRLSSSRWSWLTSWSRSAWATSWTRRNWSACRCSNCLF